ncbi:MAG: glycosyltransferase family 4 protein [Ignavibacteriae bacterium]|nr:glycosyltransferase family 4 protein [Ignavibacteriota bacterium]
MRIAFDVSYIQTNRAGIGRHAVQLLSSLLSADTENEYVLHGWSFGLDMQAVSSLADTRAKLSVARIPGVVKRFYWNTLAVPSVGTFVGEIDVFHSTDPSLPPVRNAKTICTVHDLSYMKFPHLFEKNVIALDAIVRRAVQRASAVIVPSDQTKADVTELLAVPSEKIQRIYLPVDSIFTSVKDVQCDDDVRRKFGIDGPYILFVGTLEPRKNIEKLIAAFELMLKEQKLDVTLLLIGKRGWLYEGILHAMNTSAERQRIRYLNYVSDRELASLYRQALMFVYPSLYEGYGFPVLEAMACGVPIITSGNSSMREMADGVAHLVDPNSVEGIAEAMLLLFENEVRRIEMRQRGEMVVRNLRTNNPAREVIALYKDLNSERRNARV